VCLSLRQVRFPTTIDRAVVRPIGAQRGSSGVDGRFASWHLEAYSMVVNRGLGVFSENEMLRTYFAWGKREGRVALASDVCLQVDLPALGGRRARLLHRGCVRVDGARLFPLP
jgi:hypothetical protein